MVAAVLSLQGVDLQGKMVAHSTLRNWKASGETVNNETVCSRAILLFLKWRLVEKSTSTDTLFYI